MPAASVSLGSQHCLFNQGVRWFLLGTPVYAVTGKTPQDSNRDGCGCHPVRFSPLGDYLLPDDECLEDQSVVFFCCCLKE